MATAGDLVVNLGLNSKPFDAGITKAKGGMTDFATSATTLLNPVTAAFAAIAASAAAAGLSVYGIGQRIETLAGIADKAKQTGLSGEFIQGLAYAADQSGVSIDGLMGGLEHMTRILGKNQLESEETAKAFSQIGLQAEDLAAMSPEEQFLAISDAISKLPSVAEKAAATAAIFGRSTAEMGPLLGEGAKGIRALMDEAKNLKIGISEEDLKSIATADDAMQRMKSSLSSVVSNIAVGMAPLFESMSNTITEITPKIAEIARAMSTGLADAIQKGVTIFNEELLPSIKEFLTVSGDVLTKWSGMEDKFTFAGELLKAIFAVVTETIKSKWREMLDDMLKATAEKAKTLMGMLNPSTYASAILDYATGLGGDDIYSGMRANGETDLDVANRNLDNLIRKLNGQEPLPAPGARAIVKEETVPGGMSKGDADKIRGAMMGGAGGKDPNITATEKQTAALLEGLKSIVPPKMSVVPAF